MKEIILDKPFASEEEYFLFEEKSELKHEYINSTLFEMSGAPIIHNKIERRLGNLLEHLLGITSQLEVLTEGAKVRTPDENFFYPDVIVCEISDEKYYRDRPILLAEILSDSTKAFDLTDKFIQYRKFNTLEYYLCIQPEYPMVHFYSKSADKEWLIDIYTKVDDVIDLPVLGISFSLKDIYKS